MEEKLHGHMSFDRGGIRQGRGQSDGAEYTNKIVSADKRMIYKGQAKYNIDPDHYNHAQSTNTGDRPQGFGKADKNGRPRC